MQKALTIQPVGWQSKDAVQIVIGPDATFLQLKQRTASALGALADAPVSYKA